MGGDMQFEERLPTWLRKKKARIEDETIRA
jgi:hypothetical protein